MNVNAAKGVLREPPKVSFTTLVVEAALLIGIGALMVLLAG